MPFASQQSPELLIPALPQDVVTDVGSLEAYTMQRIRGLYIADAVLGPTVTIIKSFDALDKKYDIELAREAWEVINVALTIGAKADPAMDVHTNEEAVVAVAGLHDCGKPRIDHGVLIRSQHGGFTDDDMIATKKHPEHSAAVVREEGIPLIPVELFPGGVTENVDTAKSVHASHDKQIKGAYLIGPKLNWAERRVRDYATIADQTVAMLFRDNDFNRHMTEKQRWAWVERAVDFVLNDYWYPPKVAAAVMEGLRTDTLIRAKSEQKWHVAANAGPLALVA